MKIIPIQLIKFFLQLNKFADILFFALLCVRSKLHWSVPLIVCAPVFRLLNTASYWSPLPLFMLISQASPSLYHAALSLSLCLL